MRLVRRIARQAGRLLAVALLAGVLPGARDAAAQEPARHGVPASAARAAAEVFNAAATVRSIGPYTLDSAATVRGDLAVIDGPLIVAGRVTGRLVAINTDVTLRPGAVVEGDVLVVGGRVIGRERADVRGDVQVHAERLAYREADDRIVVDDAPLGVEEWWHRLRERRDRAGARFLVTSGKTYNRVEGLPIMAGPQYRGRFDWGKVDVEALGVLRTANDASWDSENLGHLVRTELRVGRPRGTLVGGELYDVVRPVEAWQLEADEVGLAALFVRRDFRDYFDAHGGRVFAGLFAGPDADVRLSYAAERWGTRREREPFSVFRNGRPWRANPPADEGRFHVLNTTLRVDTRNVENRPWSGWYVVTDYEHGRGRVERFALPSPDSRPVLDPRVAYGRGFLDVRRYNRVAPGAQVNLRLVLGGWLHGDPLPAQRRLSVSGPGALPGYDFRERLGSVDVHQCSRGVPDVGNPAQCDRIALVQAEYRGDVRVAFGLGDAFEPRRERNRSAAWVVFVNSGRGWLVGEPPAAATGADRRLWLGRGALPALGSFRSDVGAGLDVGPFGVYVAKAVSVHGQPANVFLRLRERF
jgi:hypothetical protein